MKQAITETELRTAQRFKVDTLFIAGLRSFSPCFGILWKWRKVEGGWEVHKDWDPSLGEELL
jgi:hypothetical protein